MKSIIRNFLFVLKQFATSSILIFLGLTGALAVFIICILQVDYDYNYNRKFERHEDIFTGILKDVAEDRLSTHFNTKIPEMMAQSSVYIEEYTSIADNSTSFSIQNSEKFIRLNEYKVQPSFLKIIKPKILFGNVELGIQEGNHIIITAETALKLFGQLDVVGKSMTSYDQERIFTIEAVIADFPKNSFLKDVETLSFLGHDDPTEYSYRCLFLLKKENKKKVERSFESLISRELNSANNENKIQLHLVNIVDYHRNSNFENAWSRIYSFFTIGFIILLIAFINYINFSLILSPTRLKSLNIQRILGLSKTTQRFTLMMESAIFSILAFIFACILVLILSRTDLSTLFIGSLEIDQNIRFVLTMCLGVFFTGLLIGYYPAFYATSFNEIDVLRGGGLMGANSKKLRNILVVFQIATACALPIITSFIYLQYNYVLNYSWGIEKENIIYFDFYKTEQNFELLLDNLKENPNVMECTSSRFIPGRVYMSWGRNWKAKRLNVVAWPVLPNFLDFFGVQVIAGENFPSQEDGTERTIINQTFVDKYFPKEKLIGENFPGIYKDSQICGIAKDVNFSSLHSNIEPMIFTTMANQNKGVIFVKIAKGSNIPEVVEWIHKEINKSAMSEVEISFLNERLDALYSYEQKQAKIITIFCIIIILITLMGVYGLINFNVRFREKEIALRKINGASEHDILQLLNKNLVIQFIIGFALSIPFAYYISFYWIEQFAYRITLSWWVFALCGLAVLLFILTTVSIQSYKAAIKNPITSLKSE